MILQDSIKIEIKRANVRFYKSKYNCKVGDVVDISIEDLPNESSNEINVKCDVCGFEKQLSYRKYRKNINRQGYYSCSSRCSTEKKRKTFMDNYGFDNPNKSVEVRNKTKKTCLEKYGFDNPNKSVEVRNKTKKTCLEKYNNETYLNSNIFKANMLQSYGVENPMMSIVVNNNRIKNSFKINDYYLIKYQGKYELDFLIFCKKNHIFVEKPNFSISYTYLSEEKKYLPDFYISGLNLIIEIKSTYYFNLHKEKNIKKIESVKDNGYNFILILDKNYKEFKEFYEKNIDFHRSWC